MDKDKWVKRWGMEVAPTPVRPGVYRRRDGGLLVRVLVADPKGKRVERKRALPAGTSLPEAMRVRDELATQIKSAPPPLLPLFSSYALSLLRRKVLRGDIKSVAGQDKWTAQLDGSLIPAFGNARLDELRRAHVEAWLDDQAELVRDGKAKPSTVNTRLAILRTILAAAAVEHQIADAAAGVRGLDTSEHPTYTDEKPNSLTLDETRRFLTAAREVCPQHYAMILLGFVTGQRPSHMQPLRRRGDEADVLWDKGIVLIRRSHTRGERAMNTTKTGRRQRIALSPEVMAVLRWHCATQLRTDAQMTSDLLFPSEVGTMRCSSMLTKPFEVIGKAAGLTKPFSPRGMRRTFQDLMRSAGVSDLVTRSISGHATATMQHHYSTVGEDEQRAAGGKVVSLLPRLAPAEGSAAHG